MSYLKSIKRLSAGSNLGGIVKLSVARKDDVEYIPDDINSVIIGDIVFKAGKGFVIWDVTLETPRIEINSRTTREGSSKTNRLSFSVPKDRSDIREMFSIAEDDEFIVLQQDGNGTRRLLGTLSNPVRFEYNYVSGSLHSDKNAYNAQFYYQGPDNSFFYLGTITEAPPGTSPSIVRYSTGEVIAQLNASDELVVSSDFAHTFQIIPGSGGSANAAIVKWDDGTVIAALQPGDLLIVDTDFSFDFEIL